MRHIKCHLEIFLLEKEFHNEKNLTQRNYGPKGQINFYPVRNALVND